MIIAIRIVLSLIALYALYDFVFWCQVNFFGPNYWQFDCVAKVIGFAIGIPLTIAFAAGYLKKSKVVFWNTFVGVLFIEGLPLVFEQWFL